MITLVVALNQPATESRMQCALVVLLAFGTAACASDSERKAPLPRAPGREWRETVLHESASSAPIGPFVAFTADGSTLASAIGKTVRLWDVNSREEKLTLYEHTDRMILSMALSADGGLLATGSVDATVKLWDLKANRELTNFDLEYSTEKGRFGPHAESLSFSRDGSLLAATWGNRIKVWDVGTLKEAASLEGHTENTLTVAFGSDDTLASGSGDSTVKLWNVKTGDYNTTLEAHTSDVRTVAFSGDGKLLATGGDNEVKVWEPSTGNRIATFKAPIPDIGFSVLHVAFSRDGETLVSGTGGQIHVWDVATGELRARLNRFKLPQSVAFGGDRNLLAVGLGAEPPSVVLWDIPPRNSDE